MRDARCAGARGRGASRGAVLTCRPVRVRRTLPGSARTGPSGRAMLRCAGECPRSGRASGSRRPVDPRRPSRGDAAGVRRREEGTGRRRPVGWADEEGRGAGVRAGRRRGREAGVAAGRLAEAGAGALARCATRGQGGRCRRGPSARRGAAAAAGIAPATRGALAMSGVGLGVEMGRRRSNRRGRPRTGRRARPRTRAAGCSGAFGRIATGAACRGVWPWCFVGAGPSGNAPIRLMVGIGPAAVKGVQDPGNPRGRADADCRRARVAE